MGQDRSKRMVIDIRDQCKAYGVPLFVKQMGSAWARACQAKDKKGGDMSEWSADLRVRNYPASL